MTPAEHAAPAVSAPPVHPNLITAARLPLAPLAVVFLVQQTVWGYATAAVLALLLEITDLADGWLARRYRVVSNFGKLFDPFSDAFSRFTLFLGLYAIDVLGPAGLWMVLAIYYRDSTVSFLRSIAATRNVVIAARQSGKIKAVVQGVGTQVAFLALLLGAAVPGWSDALASVPAWTMAVMTVVTLWSLVDYVAGTWSILVGAWNDDKEA